MPPALVSPARRDNARTLPLLSFGVAGATIIGGLASPAAAQDLAAVRIAPTSSFTNALFVTAAPNDTTRLFVVEQAGRIKIIRGSTALPTPFLDMSSIVNSTGWLEWGLLGLAFAPDYATSGVFYVNYTDLTGNTQIARFHRSATDPDRADLASREPILAISQPAIHHRAGWLDFGADGYLYDAQGDGGPEGDPNHKAQNIHLLQGKILRLDVSGPDDFPADPLKNYRIPPTNPFVGRDGEDEIWALGLRNPWRCSFDRQTHDLWIGDVGQSAREEVDFQPAASTGGENYGWACTEGTFCRNNIDCTCNGPTLTPPIYEYPRTQGVSVTGGYVYRGCALPAAYRGTYFFADWGSRKIWSFVRAGGGVAQFTDRTVELTPQGATIGNIRSFGEDARGEIYFCDTTQIFKIVPRAAITDCNHNGSADACDIASGSSRDANGDGVPDECQCRVDFDANGTVNVSDFLAYLQAYADGAQTADFTGDGQVNIADFLAFLGAYAAGC
jgi:glucose/arabinose dehydrogenase